MLCLLTTKAETIMRLNSMGRILSFLMIICCVILFMIAANKYWSAFISHEKKRQSFWFGIMIISMVAMLLFGAWFFFIFDGKAFV